LQQFLYIKADYLLDDLGSFSEVDGT